MVERAEQEGVKPLHHYANGFRQWDYLFSLAGVDVYANSNDIKEYFRIQASRYDYHLYTRTNLRQLEADYPEVYFALLIDGRLTQRMDRS